jgi:hypothetical protein
VIKRPDLLNDALFTSGIKEPRGQAGEKPEGKGKARSEEHGARGEGRGARGGRKNARLSSLQIRGKRALNLSLRGWQRRLRRSPIPMSGGLDEAEEDVAIEECPRPLGACAVAT